MCREALRFLQFFHMRFERKMAQPVAISSTTAVSATPQLMEPICVLQGVFDDNRRGQQRDQISPL